MNDISALLVATTVLSIGGMGMIMYKSTDETQEEEEINEIHDEDNDAIDLGNIWNSITGLFNLSDDENVNVDKEDEDIGDDVPEEYEDEELEEEEYYERPKKKQQKQQK